MKTLPATEFKTRCLALMDEVADTGEEILILKRGQAVARLVPVTAHVDSPQATLIGTMSAMDDLIEPPLPPGAWEAEDR